MPVENLTILRTDTNHRACKLFGADGVVDDYDAGRLFAFEERPLSTIDDLYRTLLGIESDPRAFVIRGRPRAYIARDATVPRKCNGEDAAFEEQLLRIICTDIDSVESPDGVDPLSAEAVEYVVSLLPEEFRSASYVFQFSGSAGTQRGGRKVKVHLWWILNRPVSNQELRRWAIAGKVVDHAVFNAVQPHYVARPLFVDGAIDPFGGQSRVHLVRKQSDVVDLKLPELATHARHPAPLRDTGTILERNDDGKIIDGREGFLRDLRWRLLQGGHIRSPAQFTERVITEFLARAVTGRTARSENIYTQESIAALCQGDWDKYGSIIPEPPRAKLSAHEAGDKLRTTIQTAIRRSGQAAIKATAGLGKTRTTAQELVGLEDIEFRYLEIYAPRKEEQRAWMTYLQDAAADAGKALNIQAVFGRSADNCIKSEQAECIAQMGLPVRKMLCQSDKGPECEVHGQCPYLAQFANVQPGIRIFNHAHLSTPRHPGWATPSVIVIDEAFHASLCSIKEIKLSDVGALVGFRTYALALEAQNEVFPVLKSLCEALVNRSPLLEGLRNRGISPAMLRDIARRLRGVIQFANIWPNTPPEAIKRELKQSRHREGQVTIALLHALARELETARLESHAVKRLDGGAFKLCVREDVPRLADVATLVVLDADFELENSIPFLPEIVCETIQARENCRIEQCEDLNMGRGYLGLCDDQELDKKAVSNIVSFIRAKKGKRVLVVTYKSLVPALQEQLPHVAFAHFGGLRGSNLWEACDTAIIVGRQWIPDWGIEELARALHYDAECPLKFAPPIARRYASGRGVLWSKDELDPRLQAIRVTTREAETRQALARLRSVHAPERKRVYLLSAQPVGVAVDALFSFEPGKAERIFRQLGMLPFRAADLARVAAQEFESAKVAEYWKKRSENGAVPIVELLGRRSESFCLLDYRPRGGRGPASKVLVSPMVHPMPEYSLASDLNAVVDPLPWQEDQLENLPSSAICKSLTEPTSGRKNWLVVLGAGRRQ